MNIRRNSLICQHNYNLVPRPTVLLIDEHGVQVMERRETYDDLLLRYQQA